MPKANNTKTLVEKIPCSALSQDSQWQYQWKKQQQLPKLIKGQPCCPKMNWHLCKLSMWKHDPPLARSKAVAVKYSKEAKRRRHEWCLRIIWSLGHIHQHLLRDHRTWIGTHFRKNSISRERVVAIYNSF